jgi:hypothetical protein
MQAARQRRAAALLRRRAGLGSSARSLLGRQRSTQQHSGKQHEHVSEVLKALHVIIQVHVVYHIWE